MTWNLTPNDTRFVRNFDLDEKTDWLEVEQTANVSLNAKFMSYSAGEYVMCVTCCPSEHCENCCK